MPHNAPFGLYTRTELDAAVQVARADLTSPSPCGQKFADGTPHRMLDWKVTKLGVSAQGTGSGRYVHEGHCLICASEQKLRADMEQQFEIADALIRQERDELKRQSQASAYVTIDKHNAVCADLTALREGLAGLVGFIDSGVLVRSISNDDDPDWAIHILPLIACLQKVKALLAPPAASGRETEKPDMGYVGESSIPWDSVEGGPKPEGGEGQKS